MKQLKILPLLLAALAVGAAAGWFAAGFWGTVSGEMVGRDDPIAPVRVPRDRNGEQDGRAVAPRPPDTVRLARRASPADAAKKDAERIAAAKAALKASGETPFTDLYLQRAEAVKRLKEEGKKETVGEMRRLAPDWFENASRWTYGKGDAFRRRTVEMLEILTALDVSGRTDKEREVHAKYMEILADAAQKFDAKIDAVTDDTPTGEFFGINNEIFMQTGKPLWKDKLLIREEKMLRDLTARNLGFSTEEMSEMMSALKWLAAEKHARELGYSDEDAATIAYALRDLDYISRVIF